MGQIIAAAVASAAFGDRFGMRTIVWLRSTCGALGVAACAGVAPVDRDAALASLVAAERAFAAMALASGIRPAFAANFAVNGIAFEPAPTEASRAFFSKPAPPDARPLVLAWEPAAAGVAASGHFGFTTGPSTLTDRDSGRSLREGVYFSVWTRDRNGPWRVALDAGTSAPARVEAASLAPPPRLAHARSDPAAARTAIEAIEARRVDAAGYAIWFAADGRLHRDGFAPFVGVASVRAHLSSLAPTTLAFAAQRTVVASSGDLAYTYGALTSTAASVPTGYYAHLWSRDIDGRWSLIVGVLLPAGG
jgi:ketosteroid isomerase-like protein